MARKPRIDDENSNHVTFPHLDAPSLVAQSPFAMLSLSRAARASATSRATAASLSATRSYHKNVRVTQPPPCRAISPIFFAQRASTRFAFRVPSLASSPLTRNSPSPLSPSAFARLQVVDHFEKPRNVGSFDKSDANVGTGLVGAPACGDVMKLQIRVDDDGNIVDSCFKTFGCGSAIASSSVVTEWVKGQHVDEAVTIKNSEIAKHLNLPPVKLHCSMLAEDAIKAAVEDLKKKKAASA